MSASTEASTSVTLLTPQQIEILQQQIRQFKNLGKKFSESKIPKLIEGIQQNPSQSQNAKTNMKEPLKSVSNNKESVHSQAPPANTAASAPVQPALSWQCFNSLLFCGPNKFPQDGAIAFSSSVSMKFCATTHLKLYLLLWLH